MGAFKERVFNRDTWFPSGIWMECRIQLKLSIAMGLMSIGSMATPVVSTSFGGHLGKKQLAVISLASVCCNCLGQVVARGMSTACDTVIAQVYGSPNWRDVGIHLQKGVIVTTLLLTPFFAILLNIGPILKLCGQDPELAELSGVYTAIHLPGVLAMAITLVLSRYGQSQVASNWFAFIMILGFGIQALFSYLLLYVAELDLFGSSMALNIGFFVSLVMAVAYVYLSGSKNGMWSGWDLRCLLDWGDITLLAVNGAFMTSSEWWVYEIGVLLAGLFGTIELDSQSIVYTWLILLHGGPSIGLGRAVGNRVGQHLGANDPDAAIVANKASMYIAVLFSLVECVAVVFLRKYLPMMMTTDSDVLQLSSDLLPFVAAYTLMDNVMTISRYSIRACAKQKLLSRMVFVAYYLVGMPIGIPLMFCTSVELRGFWIGLLLGIFVGSMSSTIYLLFIGDWKAFAEQAQKRTGVEKDKESKSLIPVQNGEGKDYTELNLGECEREDEEKSAVPSSVIRKRVLTGLLCLAVIIVAIVIRELLSINYGNTVVELEDVTTIQTTLVDFESENTTAW